MTKIKIVKGVYGHKTGGSTIPKDKNSEPFEVSEETAQRLIKLGVAKVASELKSEADKPIKYSQSLAPVNNLVDKSKKEESAENTTEENSESGDETETGSTGLVYSMDNTQKELLAMAVSLGFDGKDTTAKAQLIEFLDNATSTEETEESEADAPQIGNDAGVVG